MRPALQRVLRRAWRARRFVPVPRSLPVGALLDRLLSPRGSAWPPDLSTPESLDALHLPHRIEPLCRDTGGAGDLMPRLEHTAFAAPPNEWHATLHEPTCPVSIPAWDEILERAGLGAPLDTARVRQVAGSRRWRTVAAASTRSQAKCIG